MDALADSVLAMPVEEIRAEFTSAGLDPDAEVQHTKNRLLQQIAESEAEGVNLAADSFWNRAREAVSTIAKLPVGMLEKQHLLEVTFAKAASNSLTDVPKIIEAMDDLNAEERQALAEAVKKALSPK